jgi:predicted negative regulator of RcsB-dependent stress response
MRSVAMLQLAAMHLEAKQYDDALKVLADKHDAAFDGLFSDLKGDALMAQGKQADAKVAYKEALSKLDDKGRYYQITTHKLEALGS